MARLPNCSVQHALLIFGVAVLLLLAGSMLPQHQPTPILVSPSVTTSMGKYSFNKPKGVTISGVIFYGRARFVDILDCYLQKNLAVNGGMLDDVLFMENTDNEADLAYLQELVSRVPQYKRIPVSRPGDTHGWGGFDTIWGSLTAEDTIYMKIDDDIVWIEDDAVPRMIDSLIRHPEAHDIAGNIINSPITNWLHYHNGAVHPFLPELTPPESHSVPTDWRVSSLPAYQDTPSEKYDWEPQKNKPEAHFEVGQEGGPPFEGHRWLPLNNTSENLLKTPIEAASYDAFGMAWTSWAIGAQQHYSLLKNLEEGLLNRYWFGNGDGIWNMQYGRYNLNFLAIWGSSVKKGLPGFDDEQDLTVTVPFKLKKPCLVDTRALVAHFNFGTQPEIGHSDLLDRYRLYANEHICAADNQKKPLS